MKKINLANLPTDIIKLEKLSSKYKKNIFIKRDDYTGTEISGNKVRKLEYAIGEALDKNSDTIITTGAIQSNHCRATAAVCAKLGLECHLILRGNPTDIEGNLFLDYILGANIHFIQNDESAEDKMNELDKSLRNKGKKPYMIPVGASNPIGTYGYINTYHEILKQEKELEDKFDLISVPVGSGGTYAGLWYGNYMNHGEKRILGFAVCDSEGYFKNEIKDILLKINDNIESFDSMEINDSYIGKGYAKATKEELAFYYDIARLEGVVLDPCYTGKAFKGLLEEIQAGNIAEENILFIHTGGLMGWTKEYRDMIYELASNK